MVDKFEASRTKDVEMRLKTLKVDEYVNLITQGVPHSLTHRTHLSCDTSQPKSRLSLVVCICYMHTYLVGLNFTHTCFKT